MVTKPVESIEILPGYSSPQIPVMFTIRQINEAHAKVKSGADFPAYVQELIGLGILHYDTYLADGRNIYFGENGYRITADSRQPLLQIAPQCNKPAFQYCLKIHQQGSTDYPTFCRDAAAAGIYKWTVDFSKMTCTYSDKSGKEILSEKLLAF